MFTRDIPQAIKFYGEVLGLRLSDRSGDMIAFMHGIHGSDHHVIAFVKSEGPGLHHLSWDVPSINDIGIGAMQMADKGFTAGWGLGRHVLGSNYFHYVRDPWGSYAEYSSDVDYIPVDHDWKSGDHPPEDSFYVWGPVPPQDFAFNHEAGVVGRCAGSGVTSDPLRLAVVAASAPPGQRSCVSGTISLASRPFGLEGLLHLAVELALDHHGDQLGAEARRAGCACGAGPPRSFQSSISVRPRSVRSTVHVTSTRPGAAGQAAVLAGIGRKLVHRHAQPEGRVRLEEHIGPGEARCGRDRAPAAY